MTMNTKFKASVKPGKQRTYRRNMPLHLRGSLLSAHLSKELRQKHGMRSIRVRTGDKVVVIKGGHKKKSGKVDRVDLRRERVYITGIESVRIDGRKTQYPIRPNNLVIVELAEDRRRLAPVTGGKK